jgi:hypothetical protein
MNRSANHIGDLDATAMRTLLFDLEIAPETEQWINNFLSNPGERTRSNLDIMLSNLVANKAITRYQREKLRGGSNSTAVFLERAFLDQKFGSKSFIGHKSRSHVDYGLQMSLDDGFCERCGGYHSDGKCLKGMRFSNENLPQHMLTLPLPSQGRIMAQAPRPPPAFLQPNGQRFEHNAFANILSQQSHVPGVSVPAQAVLPVTMRLQTHTSTGSQQLARAAASLPQVTVNHPPLHSTSSGINAPGAPRTGQGIENQSGLSNAKLSRPRKLFNFYEFFYVDVSEIHPNAVERAEAGELILEGGGRKLLPKKKPGCVIVSNGVCERLHGGYFSNHFFLDLRVLRELVRTREPLRAEHMFMLVWVTAVASIPSFHHPNTDLLIVLLKRVFPRGVPDQASAAASTSAVSSSSHVPDDQEPPEELDDQANAAASTSTVSSSSHMPDDQEPPEELDDEAIIEYYLAMERQNPFENAEAEDDIRLAEQDQSDSEEGESDYGQEIYEEYNF